MVTLEVMPKGSKAYKFRTVNGRKRKVSPMMVAKQEAAREKQQNALELRKAGATYNEIAQALGFYDGSAAKRAVDKAMLRVEVDSAKDLILLDLQRLDELQKRCMAQLRNKNDLSQVDRILRIMTQRYALAGISENVASELREAMGITQQITNNNTALVIQVNPNSEEAYIRKMMGAAGASEETINTYVEEKLKPKELTPGPTKKKKVVRRKKRGTEKAPVEGVSEEARIVGKLMGVDNNTTTYGDLAYKDSIVRNVEDNTTYGSINEEDIVDAELVDD